MRIDVVGRHIQVTDAIREYAESKTSRLPRYFDGVQQINVTLSRKNNHHSVNSPNFKGRLSVYAGLIISCQNELTLPAQWYRIFNFPDAGRPLLVPPKKRTFPIEQKNSKSRIEANQQVPSNT